MLYKNISNIRYANESGSAFFVDAFDEMDNEVGLFVERVGTFVDLFDEIVAGDHGDIQPHEPETAVEDVLGNYRAQLKCSRLQAMAVLYQHGILDSVQAMVDNSGDFILQLAWKEAQVFERTSGLIEAMKENLTWSDGSPITDTELDELFEEALTINL